MAEQTPTNRRVTVDEAADILGITPGAVRNRISRSTLRSVREGGRVFVLLPAGEDRHTTGLQSANDALISQLRSEIKYLREENQRKDHLLAAALERIPPQLEAPSESRGSPSEATSTETAEGVERRGFWARLFGG